MCVCVGIYCMYALVCVCVCLEVEVGGHRNATEASPSSCASRCASPTAPAGARGAAEPPKLRRKSGAVVFFFFFLCARRLGSRTPAPGDSATILSRHNGGRRVTSAGRARR